MNDNTDETFTRTSPPLNRFTVKLGGPAPWDVLTAEDARYYAGLLEKDGRIGSAWRLRAYADAVDAMTQPARIEYETEEA
ncbi:MAG: hypothetical protein KDH86_14505 [Anaerolineae bacterium]|nr:hypothetical protein [Anaerolineae bacterium]